MWPDALWVWTGTLYRTFCHHILTPHLFFCLFVFIFVGISPLCHVSLCCWASSKPKASWAHEKLLRWVRGGFPLLTCWQWGWECGTAALCSPTVDIYTRGLNLWYLLSGRLPSEKFLNVPKRSNRRTGSLYVCISMLAKCATNWSFKKQSKALSVLVSFFFFFLIWREMSHMKANQNPPPNPAAVLSKCPCIRCSLVFFVWKILFRFKCPTQLWGKYFGNYNTTSPPSHHPLVVTIEFALIWNQSSSWIIETMLSQVISLLSTFFVVIGN